MLILTGGLNAATWPVVLTSLVLQRHRSCNHWVENLFTKPHNFNSVGNCQCHSSQTNCTCKECGLAISKTPDCPLLYERSQDRTLKHLNIVYNWIKLVTMFLLLSLS